MSTVDPSIAFSLSAEETAEELLRALNRLHAEGKVQIRTEPRILNHIDSPVAVEADGNIWVYGLIVVVLLVWWRGGATPALVATAVAILVYFTLGRAYVHRRLDRRVRELALQDIGCWRKVWRMGGVTLLAASGVPAECRAPEGNWLAFVRDAVGSKPGGS